MSAKRPKVEVARIYVKRMALKSATLTESQASVVSANIVKSLPDDYEMFPAEDLKQVLADVSVEWRDTKIAPKYSAVVKS